MVTGEVPLRDTISIEELRLDHAAALLRQSGHELDGENSETATQRLQRLIDTLCDLSAHDALTGLANMRQFRSALDGELDRVKRTGMPLVLLLIDADRFKSINDTYGHLAGDQVLRTLAMRLRNGLRPMDMLARYGGEEFVVILPNCLSAHGRRVAERIRKQVAESPIELPDGRFISVTVSVGGAALPAWETGRPEDLIAAADRQLYCAKSSGRDRVAMEVAPEPGVSGEERNALLLPNG